MKTQILESLSAMRYPLAGNASSFAGVRPNCFGLPSQAIGGDEGTGKLLWTSGNVLAKYTTFLVLWDILATHTFNPRIRDNFLNKHTFYENENNNTITVYGSS